MTAPLLRSGYVLSYDMVFVPRQPITATTLGLGGAVPRPVPTDLVIALMSRVVPADVVQKALLVAVFVLAGWGVGRLVPGRAAGAAAAVAYTWNAFVAERLVIGHLSVLLGYALLPWAVYAALHVQRSERFPALVCLWLFASALCGATAGVTVAAVVLIVLAWQVAQRRLRPAVVGVTAVAAIAVNAPWWLPAVLRPGGIPADPRGVTAFAAHPDGPLGTLGSLLTLGGIWNSAVVPPERRVTGLAVATLIGVVVVVAVGAPRVARWWNGSGAALLLAALAGLLVAAAGWLPGVHTVLRSVVVDVSGGGLLRDGQKFLAPFALGLALCVGATVDRLLAARRVETVVLALGIAVLPVVALPGLAWGVAGRLSPVHYPAEWAAVRHIVATSTAPGDVAVLPWGPYRRFSWNGHRVVLDPAQRMFPRAVVTDDRLPLTTLTVGGEDTRAARITSALSAGDPLPARLAALGVRFVVVERSSTGSPPARLAGARQVFAGHELAMYELVGVRPWRNGVPDVAAAGLVACCVTAMTAAGVALARMRRRSPARNQRDSGKGPMTIAPPSSV